MRVRVGIVVTCCFLMSGFAVNPLHAQESEWFSFGFSGNRETGPLPVKMMVPKDTSGKLSLILFLHGAGERGSDNEKQLVHGKEVLAKASKEHGAAVVAPQCPWSSYWAHVDRNQEAVTGRVSLNYPFYPDATPALSAVMGLLDSLLATGKYDTTQVHLMGISMGGMGVLELASRRPGRFASVTSMAGTFGPQVAPLLAMTPRLRFYHGDQDFLVHVAITRKLVGRIKAYGGNVLYHELEGANHNSWDPAFADEAFLSWLFEE